VGIIYCTRVVGYGASAIFRVFEMSVVAGYIRLATFIAHIVYIWCKSSGDRGGDKTFEMTDMCSSNRLLTPDTYRDGREKRKRKLWL
jgi:hypothetical protein